MDGRQILVGCTCLENRLVERQGGFDSLALRYASVAKLVNAPDLESGGENLVGSSPTGGIGENNGKQNNETQSNRDSQSKR